MKDNHKLLFIIALCVCIVFIYKYSWKLQLMFNTLSIGMYTPDTFKIINGKENILHQRFIKGKQIASRSKIIIALLLRNVEGCIPTIIKKLKSVCSAFHDYKILIVENDSNDNTRKFLLHYASKDNKLVILGCGVNVNECHIQGIASIATEGHSINKNRIDKMIMLRNIYLDYIKRNIDLHSFDYTIIWDLDTIGSVYLDGILDSIYELNLQKNVSAICAHGIYRWLGILPLYYDTYAHQDFNDDFHIDNKLSHDIKKGLSVGLGYTRGYDCVNVKSCFSGFTIYRTQHLILSSYTESSKNTTINENTNNINCEHVNLNGKLPGKILMNPNMINLVLLNK